MKKSILLCILILFSFLFAQHSKSYRGISASHDHNSNNCYGYVLGRVEGKLVGDYFCDPQQTHAVGIPNTVDYIFHDFNEEIYNVKKGDILAWGELIRNNPYYPHDTKGHVAFVVDVPSNLNASNLGSITIDHVLRETGVEIQGVSAISYGINPCGYFTTPRGATIRATFANNLEGQEGGTILLRNSQVGILTKDNGEYVEENHPHHKYCSMTHDIVLDIKAKDPQTVNNEDYEFWRWYRDDSPVSNNVELLSNLIFTSVVYEAVFTKSIEPLSVEVTGPTLLIGTQGITKAPQYHATGTWTAIASGGVGAYTYQWQYDGYNGWTDYVGETNSSMTKTLYYSSDGHDLRCVVTSGSETASDEIHVFVTGDIFLKSTPNPFNPTTKISFVLDKQQSVELTIYSIMGKKIKTVVNSNLDIGQHSFLWDGTDFNGKPVSSGTYIYQLKAGNDVYNQRVVFAK